MIVYLASYPRSGNTFLRHCIERMYGVETLSIYNEMVLGTCQWDGEDDIDGVQFVKTHASSRSAGNHPAIYVVRDARAAIASHARWIVTHDPVYKGSNFADVLRSLVNGTAGNSSSGPPWCWYRHVRGWVGRDVPTAIIRFEDLIADPVNVVRQAVKVLHVPIGETGDVPNDFATLQDASPLFYDGSVPWSQIVYGEIENNIIAQHGAMLRQFGYIEQETQDNDTSDRESTDEPEGISIAPTEHRGGQDGD